MGGFEAEAFCSALNERGCLKMVIWLLHAVKKQALPGCITTHIAAPQATTFAYRYTFAAVADCETGASCSPQKAQAAARRTTPHA